MKLTWLKWSALPVAALLVGTAAMAQSPAPTAKPDPTIAQRKENQQDRIAQGVKSGQLTRG